MNMKQSFEDYQKVKKVLKSCHNEDQLKVGVKMVNLLDKKYSEEIPHQSWEILKNIVGLMRIKCGVEKDPIKEVSKIGKEYRLQAGMSGEPELQKLSFDESEEDTLKEINIGSQIEGNHLESDKAKELATSNINGISDYYTNPDYCIIAVENKGRDNKKTIRISKDEMDKLHMGDKLSIDGIDLMYNEEWSPLFDEEEMEESTGAGSAGPYVGPMSREVVRRVIKKDIPVSVNGIVGKNKLNNPIGKLYSFGGIKNEEEILEEDDLDEATTTADVGGVYDTPGFAASEFMGTAGKKGKAPVNKGITHTKSAYPGGKFVKIKNRCSRFPYCNQSPEAIKTSTKPFKDAFYENKIIKKGKLKIKK